MFAGVAVAKNLKNVMDDKEDLLSSLLGAPPANAEAQEELSADQQTEPFASDASLQEPITEFADPIETQDAA
jgi:hypothetical protein